MRRFGIRTTGVGLGAMLKHLRRIAPHPWIGSKLFKLEVERQFRGVVPIWNHSGRAGRIRQVSLRITDMCNLRCDTCGQWGNNGYLKGVDLRTLRGREVAYARYLEILNDLGGQVSAGKFIRIGVQAPRPQLLNFFKPSLEQIAFWLHTSPFWQEIDDLT